MTRWWLVPVIWAADVGPDGTDLPASQTRYVIPAANAAAALRTMTRALEAKGYKKQVLEVGAIGTVTEVSTFKYGREEFLILGEVNLEVSDLRK